jgi:lipase (class 3)
MITDLQAAQLCVALYAASETSHPGIDEYQTSGGIVRSLTRRPDCDVIAFRGSVTLLDWWYDLHAEPYDSRRMGYVHRGFYLGLNNVWDDMKPLLRPHLPTVLTGHSLGAGRAAIFAVA